jgi:hypothetical protein
MRLRSAIPALAFALASCAPGGSELTPCETIGEQMCEGLALLTCDGAEWVETAPCHHQCVPNAPRQVNAAEVTSDETWGCGDGPHLVTQALTVQSGATLTIEAGAEVRFSAGARIDTTQQSRLVADGTIVAPILFTSDDAVIGTYGSANLAGLNLFVRGDDGDPSSLTHAIVERAVHGVGILGLEDGKTPPVLEDNTFRDNQSWGVLLRGCVGEPAIPDLTTDNLFFNNGEGDISACQ